MLKLYRNTFNAVIENLIQIFEQNKYADRVIEKCLKSNKNWGARDRRFIAETTYEIVRWWRLLLYISSNDTFKPDYYHIIGAWLIQNDEELPPWEEFTNLDKDIIKQMYSAASVERKMKESIPDWLDELGYEELRDKWDLELQALNQQAKVVLRVNTIKININVVRNELSAIGIETIPLPEYPDALVLKTRVNLNHSALYLGGLFEIQDASSQMVAPFLKVQEGMHVVDCCAGAGGKTLHMAALMKNRGSIIALDTDPYKLEELKKRAKRAGITIIKTKQIDSFELLEELYETADFLLLDVPCSGLGIMKRHPDSKWKLSPQFIEQVQQTQKQILNTYSKILKKEGYMVYSTCSILPSENNLVINDFLKAQNNTFILEEEKTIFPSQGFDGFYMARLKRQV